MSMRELNNPILPAICSSSPPWIDLPRDVMANIIRRLDQAEILVNVQRVCTTWWSVCRQPSLWRVIHIKAFHNNLLIPYDPLRYCRLAVARSQGELIDIKIENFANNGLLRYISARSRRLKCLRLEFCNSISGECLTTSLKNFPELEELHLICMLGITELDIWAISISCPKLKSFTFNQGWSKIPLGYTKDSYAMTVAKNMPNLSHLRLFGNSLTDEGLEAILDGCRKLEYLDLRQCYGVYFNGDLKERCLNRIMVLRMPFDLIEADDKDEISYSNRYEPEDDYNEYDYDEDEDDCVISFSDDCDN